jgi:hypothetical protein
MRRWQEGTCEGHRLSDHDGRAPGARVREMVVLSGVLGELVCRPDRAASDDGHRGDPGSELHAHPAARQQCDGAFADPALSGRYPVGQDPMGERPHMDTAAGKPPDTTGEDRRQHGRGLLLEGSSQALCVRVMLGAAVRAALHVRYGELRKLLAGGLTVQQRFDRL